MGSLSCYSMICLEDLHEKRHEMEGGTDRDADDDVGNGIDTSARSLSRPDIKPLSIE